MSTPYSDSNAAKRAAQAIRRSAWWPFRKIVPRSIKSMFDEGLIRLEVTSQDSENYWVEVKVDPMYAKYVKNYPARHITAIWPDGTKEVYEFSRKELHDQQISDGLADGSSGGDDAPVPS